MCFTCTSINSEVAEKIASSDRAQQRDFPAKSRFENFRVGYAIAYPNHKEIEIGFYFHDVIILRTYSMAKYVAPLHTRPTVSDSPLYQKYVISPNSLRRVHSPELGDLLPRSPM